MTGSKYLPPALRGIARDNSHEDHPGANLYTLDEIAASFGYAVKAKGKGEEAAAEEPEDIEQLGVEKPMGGRGTLNAAYDEPGKLAYIVLFNRTHPFWRTKGELLCPKYLHLLPDPPTAASANDEPVYEQSYPVFSQRMGVCNLGGRNIGFEGYYTIRAIRYLEPHSLELIEYIEAIFGARSREYDPWVKSISRKWAVITLGRNEDRKDDEPQIEINQRKVNDILAEMRRKQ